MKTRVTFIIQDLFSQGAQRATALMARGFVEKGYEVDLVVSKVHDDYVAEGKTPFDVPPRVRWVHLKDRRASRNVGELRQYLRTTDAVAVVAMCSTYMEALAVARIGLRKCPRLYSVEHGITFALNPDWSEKRKPRWGSRDWLMWRFVRWSFDGFMTVSQRIAAEYARMFGIRNAQVVYNPVEAKGKVRGEGEGEAGRCRIVTAGSLTADKNHLLLLEAVRRVRETQKIHLTIFGEGPLRGDCERFVREHRLEDVVSLPGYTQSLSEEIRASSGYVCSSQIESFAIAPVEAMACGVPVVCCDCPCGPREILAGGRYGRLVPTGDVEAMAEAIRDLAQGKISVAPREAWERFSVANITARYERAMGLSGSSDVTWLRPVNRGGYQFFREWLTEAWEKDGGRVRADWKLPWKLKMVLGKIGAAVAGPGWMRKKGRLVVCVGGRIDYYAWPWCYRHEIVPVVWDCWPKYWPQLVKDVRMMRIKTIFCTSSQTAAHVRENCPGVNAVWLPEGIKSELYPMGPKLADRTVDVLELGRQLPRVHDGIVAHRFARPIVHQYQKGSDLLFPAFDDLVRGLQNARITISYPRCDTHPEQAGNIETLTQRYWECMLTGTLVAGRAPKELIDFCGYDPVIELGDRPAEKIAEVLARIEDYQSLADRNRAFAETHADWSFRVPCVRKALRDCEQ